MPTVTIIQPKSETEKSVKLRVAAYCRVSSDSDDQLNSLQAQMNYYESFLGKSETEELVDIYADRAITGTRDDKRDEFQRLLRDCHKGKIDRVYTKSISRFARNTKDCLNAARTLKLLGVTIQFEKENIDTANMTDEMMIEDPALNGFCWYAYCGGNHDYRIQLRGCGLPYLLCWGFNVPTKLPQTS